MKNLFHKLIILNAIFVISMLTFGQFTEAATRRTFRRVNSESAEQDTGRSRVSSAMQSEIRKLDGQDPVKDLRIPILFGVAVNQLEDTWGDARSDGRTHEGTDILVPRNEFIVSPTEAIVTTINTGGLGGNYVFTTNPGGERYYYAHLDHFAENLKEGDILQPGDLIGYVGNTGNAAGGPTHLHFGIYTDRGATNPFPRLTKEFSTKERVSAFTKILSNSNDPVTLAQKVVAEYKNVFVEALAEGIKLPISISDVLTGKRTEVLGISRILQIGMSGDDVKALQTALGITADGDFGPKTKAAVASFQASVGLPADGVFGLTTRLALANSSLVPTALPAGCTSTTAFSPTTGVKCVPMIVVPLPAGCTVTTAYSPTTGAKCRPN